MNGKKAVYIIHAAVWVGIFFSPLMFMSNGNGISMRQFAAISVVPLSQFILFYLNYLWLTPRFFIGKDKRLYWLINTLTIIVMGIGVHLWMEYSRPMFDHHSPARPHELPVFFFLIVRNCFNLAIAAAIATGIQMTMKWQAAESARHEAEAARTAAELKNLRAQINPHFLLNTLNNIYALTAIDQQRAQQTIMELSKLLRHVLYDNQLPYVNLAKETEFLISYIDLMKIRLSSQVDIRTEINIPEPCNINIAPLIFISLIENAFKHGVSATGPSFINIRLEADDNRITCSIENSNYPKNSDDNSGHGIGLKQVKARLELLYPGCYEWFAGTDKDKTTYKSTINIYDTKLHCDR